MGIKTNRGLRRTVLTFSACAAALVCMAQGRADFDTGRNAQILFNMFREVSILYVDSVDTDKMLKDAAAGMVSELDPYTELIPESDMAQFEIMTKGKYGGIGSLIHKSGDYVVISQPYRGFPADKAGLVIGDRIMEVDGRSIKGMDTEQVSGMLKGEPGSQLKVKVERILTGEIEEVTIRRERITISGVSYYGMLNDSVGYIVHSNFTEGCSDDIRKAFLELKERGMTSLVLDLRDNGGGIMQETPKIMSLFVPRDVEIVSMRGRAERTTSFRTETEPLDTEIPVAVLINNMSASAAEIVAGAFQDLDRGVLVGRRTFGKGLVQTTRPLSYSAYLKLTTAKYYTPSGRCIQAIDYSHRNADGSVGFVPDSLVGEFTTAGGRKVYDGGGVMPDVKVERPAALGAFTVLLYTKGYIEEYANRYFREHRGDPVDVDSFRFTDEDYAGFVKFMEDRDVQYESETGLALAGLRKKAESEKYLDRISAELDAIESKIKEDKQADLERFKDDIVSLLEDEIIIRFHYGEGAIRHKSHTDADVLEAIEILSDRERYLSILTTQDTQRK